MKINKKDVLIYCICIIFISLAILVRPLRNLDELWNYNFARNILEGKLPYRDFNMLQTPLIPLICSCILKIFGNELIVMRIIGVFLNSTIMFFIYKIFKELKLNKYVIASSLTWIYLLFYEYFCTDYNFSVLLITLATIYIDLKKEDTLKKSSKANILLGVFVGTSILMKQTSGLVLSFIFSFYKLLSVYKKEEFKKICKIILNRIIGVSIPVLLLIIYLILNNIIGEFFDYTVLGIKYFDNKVPYINLLINYSLDIKFLSILVPITLVYLFIIILFRKLEKTKQKNLLILSTYSIASFIVVYPIADMIHFLIASMPTILLLIYIVATGLKIENKGIMKALTSIFGLYIIYLLIVNVGCKDVFLKVPQLSNINHYKYIPSNLDNHIKEIGEYIKSEEHKKNNVYILDASACAYMIPLDKYNKNYDMFLKGNLGSKSTKEIIRELENKRNTKVLIKEQSNGELDINWQIPKEVILDILENWKLVGKIGHFDIYENK